MIDTFLKITDKVIELLKQEKLNREQFFNQIIEPLFVDLQPVVDDYFALFLSARDLVNTKSADDFRESVVEIRKARESLLAHRIKVREMAETVSAYYNDNKINGFASSIHRFFFSTRVQGEEQRVSKSKGAELVELCDYVMKDNISRRHLVSYISYTLRNLEESWVAIAQSYASIRVYCLNSSSRPRGLKRVS